MKDRRAEDGDWEYLPVADSMEEEGLWKIKVYIQIRQATIAAQVAFWKVYEMCTRSERMPGYGRMMKWWDQDVGSKEK